MRSQVVRRLGGWRHGLVLPAGRRPGAAQEQRKWTIARLEAASRYVLRPEPKSHQSDLTRRQLGSALWLRAALLVIKH